MSKHAVIRHIYPGEGVSCAICRRTRADFENGEGWTARGDTSPIQYFCPLHERECMEGSDVVIDRKVMLSQPTWISWHYWHNPQPRCIYYRMPTPKYQGEPVIHSKSGKAG